MKRYIIASGNYSEIYHTLNLGQLYKVLEEDTLRSRHHPSVCLTRSPRFAKSFLSGSADRIEKVRCVLVLDKSKLSDNYKIYPVSDNANMIDIPNKSAEGYEKYRHDTVARMQPRNSGDAQTKSEERCDKPITEISKYIEKILISKSVLDFDIGQDLVKSIEDDGYIVELY